MIEDEKLYLKDNYPEKDRKNIEDRKAITNGKQNDDTGDKDDGKADNQGADEEDNRLFHGVFSDDESDDESERY